eukprot:TRINITY_DN9813_c0_g1_i1.p1 TRINITY_DN9813_c0_g1~~TRINITY_DN9813_c0_g1_i1.p1  ORF type:complete len:114 (+),score=18.37 TRINITY_DN9813_c0_g1_i1:139-480(+)
MFNLTFGCWELHFWEFLGEGQPWGHLTGLPTEQCEQLSHEFEDDRATSPTPTQLDWTACKFTKWRKLVTSCLTYDPTKRPSIGYIQYILDDLLAYLNPQLAADKNKNRGIIVS